MMAPMNSPFSEDEPSAKIVERISSAILPTPQGEFLAIAYQSEDGTDHLALVKGEVAGKSNVLVRVHSECLTGDVFSSIRCDCGNQLKTAVELIGKSEEGILVYLRGHEGRGIGLAHKLQAYTLQDEGLDTVEANLKLGLPVDAREYEVAVQILHDLKVKSIRLLTNNPSKIIGLSKNGPPIVEKVPLPPVVTKENARYLKTKQQKLGHEFEIE